MRITTLRKQDEKITLKSKVIANYEILQKLNPQIAVASIVVP